MSTTPEQSDTSSRESSPDTTPERYAMSKKQMREKWKRVGEYGGVGLLEKARKRLHASAPKDTKQPSNLPAPERAAEPAPAASKLPIAPLSQRAPPKIVKPAPRPAGEPRTRPPTALPANIDSSSAARAIGAFRSQQRRKVPPKGVFTAPRPGLKRVMPIPVRAPQQPPLHHHHHNHHNPLYHAYWPSMSAANSSAPVWAARQAIANPLQLPSEERVTELVRLHEMYRETGAIGGLPAPFPGK